MREFWVKKVRTVKSKKVRTVKSKKIRTVKSQKIEYEHGDYREQNEHSQINF